MKLKILVGAGAALFFLVFGLMSVHILAHVPEPVSFQSNQH